MRGRILLVVFATLASTLVVTGCGSPNVDKAREYMDAGMYAEARELLALEVQDNPKSAEAHCVLGEVLLHMGAWNEAEESFNRAALLNSKYRARSAEAYFSVASRALASQDLRRAQSLFTSAKKLHPHVGSRIAELLLRTMTQRAQAGASPDECVWYLDQAGEFDLEYREEVARVGLKAATEALDSGQLPAADVYAQSALAADPAAIEPASRIYYDLGLAHVAKGNAAEGERAYHRAVELTPSADRCRAMCAALVASGINCASAGDWPRCRDAFSRAFALQPAYEENTAEFLYYAADYQGNRGDRGRAKELYDRLLQEFPRTELAEQVRQDYDWHVSPPLVSSIVGYGVDYTDGTIGDWDTQYPNPSFNDQKGRSGTANASWSGSYRITRDKLTLVIDDLRAPSRPRHTLGVGYTVTLENAVFADGSPTKSFVLHKFQWTPSLKRIEASYDIRWQP